MTTPHRSEGLRPYSGHRLHRRERVGQAYVEHVHDADLSGERTYAYNRLGFRGPEFRAGCELTVFSFGESDAFGTWVEFEETWPSQVTARLAAARGLATDQVCHMSFAESGASNAHIARMVLTQCAAVRPDLVLVNFAQLERSEGVAAGQAFPIGAWLQNKQADAAVREAPRKAGFRGRLADQLRRGRHWLEFSSSEHGMLESLREILLIQNSLAAWGIRCVAVHRDVGFLDRQEVREHPLLGPLAAQVSRDFLLPTSLQYVLSAAEFSADGDHFTPPAHAALGECVASYLLGEIGAGELARHSGRNRVGDHVRQFYEVLPFNDHKTVGAAEASVRQNAIESTYPDLHQLLRGGQVRRVVEIGCGGGWFTNTLGLHYPVEVLAVDFSAKAIERARALAGQLKQEERVRFEVANLFDFRAPEPFDLVVSLGVLHHTGDTAGALAQVLTLVRRGGHAYIGLYHEPGRRPFLNTMQGVMESQGRKAAAMHYWKLDHARQRDDRLAKSWFRDQVMHPHETQHTLREAVGWLAKTDYRMTSTSINRFQPIDDLESLFVEELAYEERARRAIEVEERYFPGFFTFMAEREG